MNNYKDIHQIEDYVYLYDMDNRKLLEDDIQFYIKYAKETKGNILELACGSGRISIPIAKTGSKIWAVDLSKPMLEKFKKRLEKLNGKIANNIHLMKADMRNFNFKQKFSLILLPFRSFQIITNDKEARSCLRSIHNHLTDDGIFILHLLKPFHDIEKNWISDEEYLDWEIKDEESNTTIQRSHLRNNIDVENQVIHIKLLFTTRNEDKQLEQKDYEVQMKYYYNSQINQLLKDHNFEIIDEFDYFTEEKKNNNHEIIFICRKKDL